MHQFRTSTTDSAFGIASHTEYDLRLGLPLYIYSTSGDCISYTYDDWGRPLTIRAPQENDTNGHPTIRYYYWDNPSPTQQVDLPDFQTFTSYPAVIGVIPEPQCHEYTGWPIWAQTLHRSQKDTDLDVSTVLFADGHGRVLQTRKTAVTDGANTQVASGHVIYDDAGRPINTFEPYETPNVDLCVYYAPEDTGVVTMAEYDILDRNIQTDIHIPLDVITTTTEYGFSSANGTTCFQTVIMDPEGRITTTLTDTRGLTIQTINALQGVTRFEYDALGQLLSSYDPENYVTSYNYDMLGHVTQREHPDAGTTYYEYDAAGNLTNETNPLGRINYSYSYNRLQHKQYSNMSANDVSYTYGVSGRSAGRPVKITDGSGVQTFEYDEMGRVAKSVRVISVPTIGYSYSFTHTYEYDSWNRMWSMTYPDGETVSYRYNMAGDLIYMDGEKDGDSRLYIENINYDKYGHRKSIIYGNGTSASYSYDRLQQLSVIHSEDASHNTMQHNEYSYDKVGNITFIGNSAGGIGNLGGIYDNSYFYDSLNRLVGATGDGFVGGQYRQFDIFEMTYSPSGRLVHKHQGCSSVSTSGIQDMTYIYPEDTDKPHAPRGIVNSEQEAYNLAWDDAGNLIRVTSQGVEDPAFNSRFLYWTEDNRLFTVADDRYYSYYTYDYTGERTLKMTGDASLVDQNAQTQQMYANLQHVTLYPSPYMVLSEQGYTKHYYAGAERVCARIGSGGLSHDTTCITQNEDVIETTDELFYNSIEFINKYVINAAIPDEPNEPDKPGELNEPNNAVLFDPYNNEDEYPTHLVIEVIPEELNFHGIIDDFSMEEPPSGHGYAEEPEVFFYHSDHLGGASWITDASGAPIQHLQYLPFGQPFVDQHPAGYQERFTFTGKEKDEETGYGYFGARYMDHELMTSFLSVDRYAGKYPSISPYAYCAWNPIKLMDPTGDTIVLTGNAKLIDKALSQIRERSSNLYFSLEDGGRLNAIQRCNKELTEEDAYMLGLINSTEVNINLWVQDNDHIAMGYEIGKGGGSYCGNRLQYNNEGGIVGADVFQAININTMNKLDRLSWSSGELIWHEISEAFEGGLIAINKGMPSPPSNNPNSTYHDAHCAAKSHFLGDIATDNVENPTIATMAILYNKCERRKQ